MSTQAIEPRDHLVQFYDEVDHLVTAVGDYIAEGLDRGEIAIVVAERAHRELFEGYLDDLGIDVGARQDDGTLCWLDATDALATFMAGDGPDPASFDATIGEVVRSARARGPVRAYGEMVAMLWADGQINAAMELEALWNDLRRLVPFSLLCSYPASLVAQGDGARFADVCRLHSDVLGAGSPRWLTPATTTDESRARTFVSEATSAPAARTFLVEVLEEWGQAAIVPDAAVIVSELAANAILHARTDFTITLTRRAGTLEICVRDGAADVPRPRAHDADSTSGRGMRLVGALAPRWGTELTSDGKAVWAQVPVTPTP